jgi:hypothetical protein
VFGDASTGAHLPEDVRGLFADTPDERALEWVRRLLHSRYGGK